MKPEPHVGSDGQLHVVRDTDHALNCIHRVSDSVERCDALVASFSGGDLVEVFGVLFLNHRRVSQHHAAQVAGCRRAEHVPVETPFDERWDIAAVVDVSVAERERIGTDRPVRQLLVQPIGLGAVPLEQSAIE